MPASFRWVSPRGEKFEIVPRAVYPNRHFARICETTLSYRRQRMRNFSRNTLSSSSAADGDGDVAIFPSVSFRGTFASRVDSLHREIERVCRFAAVRAPKSLISNKRGARVGDSLAHFLHGDFEFSRNTRK